MPWFFNLNEVEATFHLFGFQLEFCCGALMGSSTSKPSSCKVRNRLGCPVPGIKRWNLLGEREKNTHYLKWQGSGSGFFFYRTLLKGVKIDMIDIIEQNLLIGTGFQASEGFHQLQNIPDLRKNVTVHRICYVIYYITFWQTSVDLLLMLGSWGLWPLNLKVGARFSHPVRYSSMLCSVLPVILHWLQLQHPHVCL